MNHSRPNKQATKAVISAAGRIREAIESAVARQKMGDDLVPMSVLLAAAEEYQHRRAS